MMGVRTYEGGSEPRQLAPGPGIATSLSVAGLAAALLLANGRPLGSPQLEGLAGLLLRVVLAGCGLVLELDPTGQAVVGKVLSALCAGLAAAALFAAVARRASIAEARTAGLMLALGTTLAAASQSWTAEVPATAAVAVALLLLSRAEAGDDPASAARSAAALALGVMLAPATWALALVLVIATLVRWRRAVLPLAVWVVPSALLALIGVSLGSGPASASAEGTLGLALLVSPARGIVFFAPVVLVAGAGIVRVVRPPRARHHWDQGASVAWLPLAGAAAALAHVIWAAIDGTPGGGIFWGPRGLAPAWPPLLLLLPQGLALLRAVGVAIATLSVVVQAIGAFAYDGRWDRLYGDAGVTWDASRSPIVFQARERTVRLALPAVVGRRLVVRQYPLVPGGSTGSHVTFSDGRLNVSGVDPTLGDVLPEGGARVVDDRLRLPGPDAALFFRVRGEARSRRLELRVSGRGPGILGVGEKTFWTNVRWNEHRVGSTFRLRLPWSYADSGGGDIRLAARSGEIEIATVSLVPPGEPENVIRLE
jgi:hypothetical protein